jgi:hypothetical protein
MASQAEASCVSPQKSVPNRLEKITVLQASAADISVLPRA